jgi:hypothetical protein
VHVNCVEDELHPNSRVCDRGRDGTGSTVVHSGHRVERVREERRARIKRCLCNPGVGDGVSDAHDDARVGDAADRFKRSGEFGCDRNLAHHAGPDPENLSDVFRCRMEKVPGFVGAMIGWR